MTIVDPNPFSTDGRIFNPLVLMMLVFDDSCAVAGHAPAHEGHC